MGGIVSLNLINLKAKQLEDYIKEEEKNCLEIQMLLSCEKYKKNGAKLKKTSNNCTHSISKSTCLMNK